MGALVLVGGRFQKKSLDGGEPYPMPPTMGNPAIS